MFQPKSKLTKNDRKASRHGISNECTSLKTYIPNKNEIYVFRLVLMEVVKHFDQTPV